MTRSFQLLYLSVLRWSHWNIIQLKHSPFVFHTLTGSITKQGCSDVSWAWQRSSVVTLQSPCHTRVAQNARGPQKTAVARVSSRTTGRLLQTSRRSQPSPSSPKSECQWWSYHTLESHGHHPAEVHWGEEHHPGEAQTVVKEEKLPAM